MSNDLTANVPEILMLQFSQPVSGTYANGLSFGPTDTVDLGIDDPNYASSVTLSWAGKAGDLESRTYAADPSAYLANGVGIGFGADLNISAACYDIGLSIGPLSTSKSGCAYTNDFNFPLGAIPVTTVDAPLNFNSYTVDYSPIAGVGAVPELSTWAMLLIGCFGVAYAAGRQRKGHESTSLREAANTPTRLLLDQSSAERRAPTRRSRVGARLETTIS
jgi:hypothetical protein